jgi:hypothetical protein
LVNIGSFVLLVLVAGCNPVKQVLNDPAKFEKVAQQVVRRGYCVNDTTTRDTSTKIILKDSLVHDTLQLPPVDRSTESAGMVGSQGAGTAVDTTFASGARIKVTNNGKVSIAYPVKEVTREVSIDHYIRDTKKEALLQQDIDSRDSLINKLTMGKHTLEQALDDKQAQVKSLQHKIHIKTLELIGLLILILVYFGFKLYSKVGKFLPL